MHFKNYCFPTMTNRKKENTNYCEGAHVHGQLRYLHLDQCLSPVGLDQNAWQTQGNWGTELLSSKYEGCHTAHHIAPTPSIN